MPSETCDTVENFLRDVDDQISCKLGLDSVNEELRAHIEDKMELYQEYGLDREEACRRAIRDMGAPDVVGLELNQSHRLRTAKPLLFVILALMLAACMSFSPRLSEAGSNFIECLRSWAA